jgi:2'-5' RNA ligase
VKPGIVILSELTGALATRIHAVQQEYDPRMAAELPPHITLTGSSGMGPIAVDTPLAELERRLRPIVDATAPIALRFAVPMQFMQSNVVVLPIDPHGPIRDLHERIKQSGLPYATPKFAFTPHCTLSFYPELPKEKVARLLAFRFPEEFVIDRIQVYRTELLTRTKRLLDLGLTPQR